MMKESDKHYEYLKTYIAELAMLEFIKDNKYKILIEENTICIRNYIRIEDIAPLNIKIKFNDMKLVIKGKNLIINKLDSSDLRIIGNIKGIEFINEQ